LGGWAGGGSTSDDYGSGFTPRAAPWRNPGGSIWRARPVASLFAV